MTHILGLSFGYHDAAAALVSNGELVGAVQEERFSGHKHDPSMPVGAIEWCLDQIPVHDRGPITVVHHEKPFTTYERILRTHADVGPKGFRQLHRAVSQWSRSKLWVRQRIEALIDSMGYQSTGVNFSEHHLSHAAAAFLPSPYDEAAVVVVDGVGEWTTTSIWHGSGNQLTELRTLRFPDSIGLFYSAMTAYCGFAVNDGEYKLMGLAPYGRPRFADLIRQHVVDIADTGAVRLDQRFFDYRSGRSMTHSRFNRLIGFGPATDAAPLTEDHADLACSVQVVLEDVMKSIARHAVELTGSRNLCLGGGVALNCVANGRIRDDVTRDLWIQPAAGDAGSAVGAALWYWHQVLGRDRDSGDGTDRMSACRLGPRYDAEQIAGWLTANEISFRRLDRPELYATVARRLSKGDVVGWFQGASEFGPRALGSRSILADPRDRSVVGRLNRAVKGREAFRPFAPVVLSERAADWFDSSDPAPYMLTTSQVKGARPSDHPDPRSAFEERLAAVDSPVPACTHVDGSARLQTVAVDDDADLHGLLDAFHADTGCPILVNTSFNRAGEPMVLSPSDAYSTAVRSGLDVLVLEDSLIERPTGEATPW